ncbi:MAG: undecaprenyldiphospho-muramoylpentapeptide beta-N-acetylglucosaminyltransferase [Deltaproteobacteria bacterium]|nr:undecaprenyldiphospho-muramoylpentapeptide beta-N-acetylglucosaminyltransferase [Deltaproteobacteria bacterium]
MDVLIAGGGTGGHLFPGIAVAEEVRRRDPAARVLFVGTARGLEVKAVPKAGFELALLPVSGLRRTGLLGLCLGLLRLPGALFGALRLVRGFRPQVAVSVGGYAAGPAVLAARLLGVPCVVMEQNAVPGFTNRVLGRLARRVLAGLPPTGLPADKVTVVGNPVRADLLRVRGSAYAPHRPLKLLVFGGSQGARALNEVMIGAAAALEAQGVALEITHQTGGADCERVRAAYAAAGVQGPRVLPFIDDMATAYDEADLVLCRAGASTIAELAVCGRPAILVPFPFAVDDHQSANARALAAAGGAVHLPQAEMSCGRLTELVAALAREPERLRAMAAAAHRYGQPDSAATIVTALEGVASPAASSGRRPS